MSARKKISSLASDLGSLVDNLNIIEEVDSLLSLCDMDEDTRLRAVDRVLRDMELELQRLRDERDAAEAAAAAAAASDMSGAGMFWPYNGQLRNLDSRSSCPTGATVSWKTTGVA